MVEYQHKKTNQREISTNRHSPNEKSRDVLYDELKEFQESFTPIVETPFRPPVHIHTALLAGKYSNEEITHLIMQLQQTYGNRYVQHLLNSVPMPGKLTHNNPVDNYEQKADNITETVVTNLLLPPEHENEEEEGIRIIVPQGQNQEVISQQDISIGIFENRGKKCTDNLAIPAQTDRKQSDPITDIVNEPESSKVIPHIFVNGGKTGSATVHWAGGTGGTVPEGGGAVREVIPVIETSGTTAWVRAGSGTATVNRSYIGVNTGANGSYYITARAVARIDRHEELHIATARQHHDTHITPMETRITQYTGEDHAMNGDSAAAARTALENFINWRNSISSFQAADIRDNVVGGTVDTAELASADYIQDLGPRAVEGVNYAHYIDTPT